MSQASEKARYANHATGRGIAMDRFRRTGILNRTVLAVLKKSLFSGQLVVEWKEGMIVRFDFTSRVSISRSDKQDFDDVFFSFDEENSEK